MQYILKNCSIYQILKEIPSTSNKIVRVQNIRSKAQIVMFIEKETIFLNSGDIVYLIGNRYCRSKKIYDSVRFVHDNDFIYLATEEITLP